MTAAIVGGGIAGLTAAYELVRAGERPLFIDPGPIGGMIRSSQVDGFTLEAGPNVLVERPDIVELLESLGLRDSARYPCVNPYGQYVWYDGQPTKVPSGFGAMVGSPLFSWGAKFLLPWRVLLPGVLPSRGDDISVRDFLTPLVGAHAVRCLVDPVLKGIYGGEVSELSARSLFPQLWAAAQDRRSVVGCMRARPTKGKPRIMVLAGGIQRLTDAMWGEIKDHIEYIPLEVRRIIPAEGKRYTIAFSDGHRVEVDGCVVTSSGPRSAPLVAAMDEELADMLEGMRYAGLTAVHLSVPRSEPLIKDAFGVLFPGGMPLDLLGAMFNSLIFPHVAPPDRHVVTVMLGGAQAGDRVHEEGVLRRELPKLLRELLGVGDVRWLGMVRWPRAIPQLTVGHHKIVEAMDACERKFPGVVFAGTDRGGVGVSERIRIARDAVKRFRRVRVETVV